MVQNDSRTGSRPRPFWANRFFRVSGGTGIKIRNFISRRFDESVILHGADQFRHIFFRLRLRFVGTFLLTFGAYASVITVLVSLFQHEQISGAHLYSGLCAMICGGNRDRDYFCTAGKWNFICIRIAPFYRRKNAALDSICYDSFLYTEADSRQTQPHLL